MQEGAKRPFGPAVNAMGLPERRGSLYPEEYARAVQGRTKRVLGDAFALTQFGVNLVTLEPGAWSSQRHWHANEDELVYVLQGEVSLLTDEGEQTLRPGMVAGFKAGHANGHHLINRGDRTAPYIEVGTRLPNDKVDYPDIDMRGCKVDGTWTFTRKDGLPFEPSR